MLQGPAAARAFLGAIADAARADPRVSGLLVGGSLGEGRGDAYSDLDIAIFIRDDDLAGFEREWRAWAGRFGRPLLAYTGGIGHPWVVYDAKPLPLRVDFSFWPSSRAAEVAEWPCAPPTVEAMLLHDATDGALTEQVRGLVGQSLAPRDPARSFESVSGDFWYYLLRVLGKLERGDLWGAHWELQAILVGNLLGLLRLEQGKTDAWLSAAPALNASRDLEPDALAELEGALPKRIDRGELRRSLIGLAEQARRACGSLAERTGWPWPSELSDKLLVFLAEGKAGKLRLGQARDEAR